MADCLSGQLMGGTTKCASDRSCCAQDSAHAIGVHAGMLFGHVMKSKALISLIGTVIAVILVVFFPKLANSTGDAGAGATTTSAQESSASKPAPSSSNSAPSAAKKSAPTSSAIQTQIGFASRRGLDDHFEKHGAEFGSISKDEYLLRAQTLRDSPLGGSILEAVRDDGVTSRFDRQSGAFGAYNRDKTIRTFFRPNDGVRYFERQIDKAH